MCVTIFQRQAWQPSSVTSFGLASFCGKLAANIYTRWFWPLELYHDLLQYIKAILRSLGKLFFFIVTSEVDCWSVFKRLKNWDRPNACREFPPNFRRRPDQRSNRYDVMLDDCHAWRWKIVTHICLQCPSAPVNHLEIIQNLLVSRAQRSNNGHFRV